MSAPPKPSRLLALPGELRNRIYRMALVQEKVEVWRDGYERSPLINTCKAVRNETLKLYYEENKFCFYLENFEATTLLQFKKKLESIVSYLHGVNGTETIAVRRGTMFPKGPNKSWPNLLKLLKHAHAGEVRLNVTPLADRGKYDLESREAGDDVVFGMLAMANTLRGEAWEAVEKVLMDQKALLAVLGTNWIE